MSLANILTGIFIVIILYRQLSHQKLFLDDTLLIALCLINVFLQIVVICLASGLIKSLNFAQQYKTNDLLMALPDQHAFFSQINKILANVKSERILAVACFSLNELEKINEAFGFRVAECVIKVMAKRLQKFVDKINKNRRLNISYCVSLTRKDAFVILLHAFYLPKEAEIRVRALFSVVDEPVMIGKKAFNLTASIGLSLFPRHSKNAKSLLMYAHAAMIKAKTRGGNHLSIYKTNLSSGFRRQLQMEGYLHNALKNNEFKLLYQPLVEISTGKICAVEALIRWENPIIGLIPAENFIPLAEANGVILSLGEWVLQTACHQAKIWHSSGFDLKIAINLSAKQLQHKQFTDCITHIISQTGINPAWIELELTEREIFHAGMIGSLKKLKKMKFSLSIDDFGAGYSGLSNLKLLPVDQLKIDQGFIRDVMINHDSRAIITHTINLVKKINLKVVAEGVETKEQLQFLREQGCDRAQGFLFSAAVDPNLITEFLRDGTSFLL